jgi:hypothetical protein
MSSAESSKRDSVLIQGEKRLGKKHLNGSGWMDQNKVYSQWGYIEKPL